MSLKYQKIPRKHWIENGFVEIGSSRINEYYKFAVFANNRESFRITSNPLPTHPSYTPTPLLSQPYHISPTLRTLSSLIPVMMPPLPLLPFETKYCTVRSRTGQWNTLKYS